MLGELFIVTAADNALVYVGFVVEGDYDRPLARARQHLPYADYVRNNAAIAVLANDIMRLWRGEAGASAKIALHGTAFQNAVWSDLLKIPFGKTVSYGAVARNIARPKAVRAVGTAVGANPVSLLVPCHRVIQANGSFHNYGWGNAMKKRLLEAEDALF